MIVIYHQVKGNDLLHLGVAAYTNCLLSPKRQTCTQNYANLSLSLYETIRISLFLPPPSFLLPKTTATSTHQKTLAIDPTNLSLLFLTYSPTHLFTAKNHRQKTQVHM